MATFDALRPMTARTVLMGAVALVSLSGCAGGTTGPTVVPQSFEYGFEVGFNGQHATITGFIVCGTVPCRHSILQNLTHSRASGDWFLVEVYPLH